MGCSFLGFLSLFLFAFKLFIRLLEQSFEVGALFSEILVDSFEFFHNGYALVHVLAFDIFDTVLAAYEFRLFFEQLVFELLLLPHDLFQLRFELAQLYLCLLQFSVQGRNLTRKIFSNAT
jgi:hypothetical protein